MYKKLKLNKPAIRRAIKFLREKVSPKHFNMRYVLNIEGDGNSKLIVERLIKSLTKPEEVTCGAAGCFFGYFPIIYPNTWKPTRNLVLLRNKKTNKLRDFNVGIAEQLGVSEKVGIWIGDPFAYTNNPEITQIKPEQVAKRLEHILECGERVFTIADICKVCFYASKQDISKVAKELGVGITYKGKRYFNTEEREQIENRTRYND